MTTGDQNPNPQGQPPGFPPPPNPYGQPSAAGYPPPPPPGYPPPPPPPAIPRRRPDTFRRLRRMAPQPGTPRFPRPSTVGNPVGLGCVSAPASSTVCWSGSWRAWARRCRLTPQATSWLPACSPVVLMFAYFVAMEVTQGRTLGKMMLGLSVHGPAGAAKPDIKQSAIRNAFTLLTVIPYVGWTTGVHRLHRDRGDHQCQPHQTGQTRPTRRRNPGRQRLDAATRQWAGCGSTPASPRRRGRRRCARRPTPAERS